MTQIEFHVNAREKVIFTCRLLRKAVARKSKVVVTGSPSVLRELDTTLWTFSAVDFVPHCYGQATPALVAASPVLLADSARDTPHQDVLVNLGPQVPDGFERYQRLIEIVAADEDDLRHGRHRWKHYANRGYALVKHDQAAREAS